MSKTAKFSVEELLKQQNGIADLSTQPGPFQPFPIELTRQLATENNNNAHMNSLMKNFYAKLISNNHQLNNQRKLLIYL